MEHDNVNHPKHYTKGFAPVNIECIDITRHMDFCLGNAFKYVWRAGKKGGKKKALEDLIYETAEDTIDEIERDEHEVVEDGLHILSMR